MDNEGKTLRLKKILRDNISRFCTPEKTLWSRPVYHAFETLRKYGLNAVVFGGTNRTIISRNLRRHAGSASDKPRDIDIVVENVETDELCRIFKGMVKRKTRFGGLQLSSGNISFDIWPLQTTWRFTVSNDLPPAFESLPLTTFLNVEAIAVDIWPNRKVRNIYSGDGQFFDGLLSGTVELNNAENPYPALCIARALFMAVRMQFSIGANLAEYLIQNIHSVTDQAMEEAQQSHYGAVVFNSKSIRKAIDAIFREKMTKNNNRFIPKLGQLEFWHP